MPEGWAGFKVDIVFPPPSPYWEVRRPAAAPQGEAPEVP